jgi:uncharacterized damage-inducible protein DinB
VSEAETTATAMAAAIGAEFRRRLLDEYLPRIRHCVSMLSEAQLWARPNAHCNPVANLLIHLEGNVRQWILSGVGGADDHRERAAEFTARHEGTTASAAELLDRLAATVEAAVAVVAKLSAADYVRIHRFQSRWDESTLAAVLHVMEHFSGHAGQIYAFTKQELDVDLRFYDL